MCSNESNLTTAKTAVITESCVELASGVKQAWLTRTATSINHSIIGQGSLVLLDQGFQSITNFVLGIFLARSLSKTDYGIFVVLMSIILIVQGCFNALIFQPSTVYAPKMQLRRRAIYLGSTVAHQVLMIVSITLLLAMTGLVMLLLRFRSSTIYWVWLLCSATGLYTLRPFARFLLLATFRQDLAFLMGIIISIVQCSLIIIFYMQHSLTVFLALTIIAVSNSIVSISMLAFAAYRRILIINRCYMVKDLKRSWQFGKWNLGRLATSVCTSRIYPIALAAFIAPAETAIYGVCIGLAGLSNPLVMGFATFLGPYMAKQTKEVDCGRLVDHTKIAFLLIGAFYVVYLLVIGILGARLLVLLYGEQYGGNLGILLIIAFAFAVEGFACPAVATLGALEQPKVLFTSRLLAAVFTLTGGLLFLWLWGLAGAAIGMLTSNTLTTGIRFFWLRNTLHSHNSFASKQTGKMCNAQIVK